MRKNKIDKILSILRELNKDEFRDNDLTSSNTIDEVLEELMVFETNLNIGNEKQDKLVNYIIELSQGQFEENLSISKEEDEYDVIAMALNTLREELSENAVSISTFDNVFNSLNAPFFVINVKEDALTKVNSSALNYFAYGLENKYKISMGDLLPQDFIDEVIQFYNSELFNFSVEKTFIVNNTERNLIVNLAKLSFTLDNKLPDVVVMITDVTDQYERIKLENDKINLESSLKFKDEFLANMSHEMRTPLNGIIGMSEMLMNDKSITNDQEFKVDIIQKASTSLLAIINDVLDLSKLEAGKMSLHLTPVDVLDVVNSAYNLFLATANSKGIMLELNTKGLIHQFVNSDKNRITQILNNFLSNAVKFTDKGKVVITVSSKKLKDKKVEVKFSIEDDGIGISKENQGNLFEKFYQADSGASKSFQGTGLGLSVCNMLAELLGGEIGVISQLQKGSEFWFTIITDEVEGSVLKIVKAPKPIGEYNVLLVDDQEMNIIVAQMMLSDLNCKTAEAYSGKEALEMVAKYDYDIIFLDIQMPEMDGVETLEHIRKRLPNCPPIIALTANAVEGDKKKYIDKGFDDYLSKPITIDSIKGLLHNVFG